MWLILLLPAVVHGKAYGSSICGCALDVAITAGNTTSECITGNDIGGSCDPSFLCVAGCRVGCLPSKRRTLVANTSKFDVYDYLECDTSRGVFVDPKGVAPSQPFTSATCLTLDPCVCTPLQVHPLCPSFMNCDNSFLRWIENNNGCMKYAFLNATSASYMPMSSALCQIRSSSTWINKADDKTTGTLWPAETTVTCFRHTDCTQCAIPTPMAEADIPASIKAAYMIQTSSTSLNITSSTFDCPRIECTGAYSLLFLVDEKPFLLGYKQFVGCMNRDTWTVDGAYMQNDVPTPLRFMCAIPVGPTCSLSCQLKTATNCAIGCDATQLLYLPTNDSSISCTIGCRNGSRLVGESSATKAVVPLRSAICNKEGKWRVAFDALLLKPFVTFPDFYFSCTKVDEALCVCPSFHGYLRCKSCKMLALISSGCSAYYGTTNTLSCQAGYTLVASLTGDKGSIGYFKTATLLRNTWKGIRYDDNADVTILYDNFNCLQGTPPRQ